MHEIDFLPAEYRQSHARRQAQPWRVIVVLIFAALIVVASVGQYCRVKQLEAELAAIAPKHQTAVDQSRLLASLQSQLEVARADTDLFTYFRHPWPRTRIIHALLGPLPDEITFEQLEIHLEAPTGYPAGRAPVEYRSRSEREAEEAKLAKLPPAARDLKRLRDEFDVRQTIVSIAGVTTESAALHHYLGQLEQVGLFSKVELARIEMEQISRTAKLRFNATLVVRPGYGQPGGPTTRILDAASQPPVGSTGAGGPVLEARTGKDRNAPGQTDRNTT